MSSDDCRLVSIVMPAFNAADTIEASVDSVMKQTYPWWELLIIDDGSTDSTCELLAGYLTDPRIRLLRTSGRSGPALARNVGLEAAQGFYVAFLDADDLWLPEKLKIQVGAMRESRAAITCTSYYTFVDGRPDALLLINARTVTTYRSLLRTNSIGCLTAMYERTLFPTLRMPDLNSVCRGDVLADLLGRRVGHEDYAFWLSMLREGNAGRHAEVIGLRVPLAKYRIRRNSVSRNKVRVFLFVWLIYRRHLGASRSFSAMLLASYLFSYFVKTLSSRWAIVARN